jgi:hypothetical protein
MEDTHPKTIFCYNPDTLKFEEYTYIKNNINANGNNDNDYDNVSNYYIIRGLWSNIIWFNVKVRVVKKGEDIFFDYKIDHDNTILLKNLIFNENVQVVTNPPNISKYNSNIIDKFDYMEGVLIATHQLSTINSFHFVISDRYIYLCKYFQYSIDNHLNEKFGIINKKNPDFNINDIVLEGDDNDSSESYTFRIIILNNSLQSELLKWNKVMDNMIYNTKITFSDDPTEIVILLLDKNDILKDYIKCNLIPKIDKKKEKYDKIMNSVIAELDKVISIQDDITKKYNVFFMNDINISKNLDETKRLLSNYVSHLKNNNLNFGSINNTIVNISGGDIGPFTTLDDHKMAHTLYYMLLIIIYNNIDLLHLGWLTYNKNNMPNDEEYGYTRTLVHFGANMFNQELIKYLEKLKKKVKTLTKKMASNYNQIYHDKIKNDVYYNKLVSKDIIEVDKYDKNLLETVVYLEPYKEIYVNEFSNFIKLFVDLKDLIFFCHNDRVDLLDAYKDLSNAMESMFTIDNFKFSLNLMIWLHQDIDKIKTKLNMFSKKLKYIRDKRPRKINENDDDEERIIKKPRFSNYMTLNDLKMFSQFFK